jgi:polyisoprenoid-binding protein YceI
MKAVFLFLCVILFAGRSFGQTYKPVDEKSIVQFYIKNLGVTVEGRVTGLNGTIAFSANTVESSAISLSVQSSSIDTGIKLRDRHLRKVEYLDVSDYPEIRITSTSVEKGKKAGHFVFKGLLTLKGKSKMIAFPFEVRPDTEGYIFSGSFEINRRDFRVGGNSLTMADTVAIRFIILAKQSKSGV